MSLLNIGLQSVGLVRNAIEDQDLERKLTMCSNMSEIRQLAEKEPSIKDGLKKSLQPVKDLIEDVFSRLSLKDEPFQIFQAASDEEIDSIWEELRVIDATVTRDDTTQIKLKNKSALMNFMKTHCLERHYMFSVKKCGLEDCHVCRSPRLTPEHFQTLNHLPDPVPRGDHFEAFETLYGAETKEKNEVYVRQNITCSDKISIHYYGAGHEIICIHCGTLNNIEERNSQSVYPMCQTCITDKKDWVNRRVFKHNN